MKGHTRRDIHTKEHTRGGDLCIEQTDDSQVGGPADSNRNRLSSRWASFPVSRNFNDSLVE